MSSGRTLGWWPKDSGWYRRERQAALAWEFGPLGVAVLDWLATEAASQDGYEDGSVKAGYHAVAIGIGAREPDSVERVRDAVRRCETLGALENVEEDGTRFSCRISGWRADRERALRQLRNARYRTGVDPLTGQETAPESEIEARRQAHTSRVRDARRRCETVRDGARSTDSDSSNGEANASPITSEADRAEVIELCELLATAMRRNDAKAKVAPESARWRTDMRRLLDLDERTTEQVRYAIEWATRHEFWAGVIQSPAKLRDKFGQLVVQIQNEHRSGATRVPLRPHAGGRTDTPADDPGRAELERRFAVRTAQPPEAKGTT